MTSVVLTQPTHSAPFDAVADVYDEVFTNSRIGRAQRSAVWQEMDRVFLPGQRVLELNCGTGVDALHLAERGVSVLACDVSPRMIAVAEQRLAPYRAPVVRQPTDGGPTSAGTGLAAPAPQAPVVFRVLATEEIASLEGEGPFDGALSNFAGLNCVRNLSAVARDLGRLLRPRARVVLCMFGAFAAWEVVWYLAKGDVRKAFRRFARRSVPVRLAGGLSVNCAYPTVRALARIFAPEFRLKQWRGVGVSVPPTYFEPLAHRFPRIMSALEWADPWLGRCPVLRGMADHAVLDFERCRA